MFKYLIILVAILLTGCATAPKEVVITEIKTEYRSIPEQLLKKEPVPVPVEKSKYMAMDFLQKEIYLADFVMENMTALGNCNANMQAVIEYNKAQQEISK